MKALEFAEKIGKELAELVKSWLEEAVEIKSQHETIHEGWDDDGARTRYYTLCTCAEQLLKVTQGKRQNDKA